MKRAKSKIEPIRMICLISILFFALTIIYPVVYMVHYSLVWSADDLRLSQDAVQGEYTLFHWARIFNSDISWNMFYEPFLNSTAISATVTAVAFFGGTLVAWLLTSTDLPLKKFISWGIMLPYIIPSWIKSYAWIIVFNSPSYGSQGLFQYLTGITPPEWLSYGFVPIVIVMSDHYYIYFFLLMKEAFLSVGGELEGSAQVMGARRGTILRKITLPLLLPAILSGMILTFLGCFDNFGVSARLGLPVRYYTAGTRIYGTMNTRFFADAYVLSLVLIAMACLFIFINQLLLAKGKKYETVGGKGSQRRPVPLGRWKYPALALLFALILCGGVLPFLLQVLQSLTKKAGDYSLDDLTLHYWIGGSDPAYAKGQVGVLVDSDTWQALGNSLFIGLAAALLCTLAGLFIGYAVAKGKGSRPTRLVEYVSFLPYLIPGISLGAVYIAIFSRSYGPIPVLYGSTALLVIITMVKKLPYASRSGVSTVYRLGDELEEAATINGASFRQRFFRVILPLSRQSMIGTFMVIFIGAVKEMDLIVLLATPKTQTLATLTFDYADRSYSQLSNALIVLMVVILLIVYGISQKLSSIDFASRKGEHHA